uniref:Uncharacterized protein n=1 Tax=Tetraselmis sp. GSL018 TaxID=582737 RepID=A0A061SJ22_9CHLO
MVVPAVRLANRLGLLPADGTLLLLVVPRLSHGHLFVETDVELVYRDVELAAQDRVDLEIDNQFRILRSVWKHTIQNKFQILANQIHPGYILTDGLGGVLDAKDEPVKTRGGIKRREFLDTEESVSQVHSHRTRVV